MRAIFWLIIVVDTLLLLAYIFQNRIIYGCGPIQPIQPHGLPAAKRLPIWHYGEIISFERPNTAIIIYYFHGNGLRVASDYWRIAQLYAMCNCSVRAVEYPDCVDPVWLGHTQRENEEYVQKLLFTMLEPGKKHYLLGASLGTAYVISAYPYSWDGLPGLISGVILENPFTSVADVIGGYIHIPEWVLSNPWNNTDRIYWWHCDVPVLFITSGADEIVPPHMSTTLFAAWDATPGTLKKQVILEGALHGHAASHPDYLPAIADFLMKTSFTHYQSSIQHRNQSHVLPCP